MNCRDATAARQKAAGFPLRLAASEAREFAGDLGASRLPELVVLSPRFSRSDSMPRPRVCVCVRLWSDTEHDSATFPRAMGSDARENSFQCATISMK